MFRYLIQIMIKKTKQQIHHYNIFEFDEKNTNIFDLHTSKKFDNFSHRRNKQSNIDFRINPIETYYYQLELIKNQLLLQVYDHGIGNFVAPNQFIQYQRRIYFEGSEEDIQRACVQTRYGNKENPQPIQLLLSMSKVRFKGKAKLGLQMGRKITKYASKKRSIVIQFLIIKITNEPNIKEIQQLVRYHNYIIQNAIQGDQAFQNGNLEESLAKYQQAVDSISNDNYSKTIFQYKKLTNRELLEDLSMFQHNKIVQNDIEDEIEDSIKNKILAEQIEDSSQKILFKAIQIALIAGEYIKVIRWAYILCANLKFQKNFRLQMIKARAYRQLGQFQRALSTLSLAAQINPHDESVKKQEQKILQMMGENLNDKIRN